MRTESGTGLCSMNGLLKKLVRALQNYGPGWLQEVLMLLKHVGLACSTEKNADRFYQKLLGLNKSEPKMLPSELSRAVFNIDAQLQFINYSNEKLHFELFITGRYTDTSCPIIHHCLEVDDLSGFIEKCRACGVSISRIPRGDRHLTFIRDFDGNLFEIKEVR
jgi:catechol 2,3-dioxygenase-like lactoylglutathione lyase family enzyme